MNNLPSKTFCSLPWTHLNVQPNGDIYPCCMSPYNQPIGNTSKDTLEEPLYNRTFEKLDAMSQLMEMLK